MMTDQIQKLIKKALNNALEDVFSRGTCPDEENIGLSKWLNQNKRNIMEKTISTDQRNPKEG